jgi:hypothetical protein
MLAVVCIVTSLTGIAQETSKTKQNTSLAGTWTRDVKNWVFQFEKDGTFKSLSSDHSGTWTIVDGNKVQMNWLSGPMATGSRTRTYTLKDGNEFSGTNPSLGFESFKRQVVAVDKNPPSSEDSKPAKPADPDIARQPSIEDSKPAKPTEPALSLQPTNKTTVASDWTPNSEAKIKRDVLYVGYTKVLAEIELKVQKAKGDVLGKYGKALEYALASLKTKGLFDDYTLVLKESDRFSSEKTIPVDPKPIHTNLAIAITECQKQLSSINNKANELVKENTTNYIKALRELVKQTMIKDKMGDAEKINEEIKLLSGIIPEPTTGLALEKSEPSGSRSTKEVAPEKEIPAVAEAGDTFVFKGHRYKFVDQARITYPQSVEACQAIGGHLVTINTPQEWEWIKKTFLKGDTEKSFRSIYLGVEMPAKKWWSDAETKWVDGTRFDMKGADWADGHPWSHKEAEGFRFRWIMNFNGQWASIGSTDDRINGFICEWDLETAPKKLSDLSVKETSKAKQGISLVGTWSRNIKNWVFRFNEDGTFNCLNSDDSGKWRIVDDSKVQLDWLTGPTGLRIRTYTLKSKDEFSGDTPGLGHESFKRQR